LTARPAAPSIAPLMIEVSQIRPGRGAAAELSLGLLLGLFTLLVLRTSGLGGLVA